ncbi:flagellar hook-associated protein FlgK [Sediminibacillus halophilus]|uniref:Flagellar hook-associated protein 1 n=1 Tax=Sediminibacillus halophilus TaxID=482461 RepID=A0A1G9RCK4_9BACI|nr:flagellar hook-associated protein FlgK [Sediminibacillus halophilus]SDM20996.1 flagellar hook-associated protein 1 FlgK [Sediminibacillus halophilus]
MSSTFNGLEVARRALTTQQSALYTTGHNIANANTEGYTRQRVNFEQTGPYPPASRNRPEIPGQVGSGVQAGSIERVRDQFLDKQYRSENAKFGYYDSKASAMEQMESIMNEPTEQGLSKTMDRFWQSLQDLATNKDEGSRSVAVQRGTAVAETFNYVSDSLNSERSNLQEEMNVTKKEINSLVRQINNLNKQIGEIEPHGLVPNDLYDERDRCIDKLSGLVNINVSYESSGGQPSAIAQGKATITLADGQGKDTDTTLIDASSGEYKQMEIGLDDEQNVEQFNFTTIDKDGNETSTDSIAAADFSSQGKMKALMESNGYIDGGEAVGEYPDMLEELNFLARNLAAALNEVHSQGIDANGDPGQEFFVIDDTDNAAASITVSEAIKEDSDLIAVSANGDSGNGENALAMAEAMRKKGVGDLGQNSSIQTYYEGIIGEMAVVAQEAERMQGNATVLRDQVDENRQSVSAVSLDEEMTNMIKFQHAYNAAARNMTTVDEMLDRIINNMGLVGR